MAVLTYNDHSESVCLDDVQISRTAIADPGTGTVIGHVERWQVTATLIGSTAQIKAAIAELEAAYDDDGHDLTLLTAAEGTTLHQLDSSASATGVHITERPSFPSLSGGEYVTKRSYRLVAQAEFFDGNPDLLWDTITYSYAVGQDEKTTQTAEGKLRTKSGVSAEGEYAGALPETPTGYNRVGAQRQVNDDDTELSWSAVDREYWRALPSGVLAGAYTSSVQESGTARTKTIAGRFVGPTAAVDGAIAALRISGRRLISELIRDEPDGGAKTFALVYEYSNSGTLEFAESVQFGDPFTRQVYAEVLDGGSPVRQTTTQTTATARVSGSAVGRASYPALPSRIWADMYLAARPVETYGPPEQSADGKHLRYPITWAYQYEFDRKLNRRHPRTR